MTRLNYNKQSLKQKGSVPNQILVILVTFFIGYLSASWVDIATLSKWASNKVSPSEPKQASPETRQAQATPAKHKFEFYTLLANEKAENPNNTNTNQATQVDAHGAASNAAALAAANTVPHPAPAANQSNNQAPNNSEPPKPGYAANPPTSYQARTPTKVVTAKPLPVSTKNYTVQVASFKERKDAEHMKGSLTLKGFNVSVVAISQPSGNWFRVLVGPYPSRLLAQKAQEGLARNERIRGMVSST